MFGLDLIGFGIKKLLELRVLWVWLVAVPTLLLVVHDVVLRQERRVKDICQVQVDLQLQNHVIVQDWLLESFWGIVWVPESLLVQNLAIFDSL